MAVQRGVATLHSPLYGQILKAEVKQWSTQSSGIGALWHPAMGTSPGLGFKGRDLYPNPSLHKQEYVHIIPTDVITTEVKSRGCFVQIEEKHLVIRTALQTSPGCESNLMLRPLAKEIRTPQSPAGRCPSP